MKRRLTPFVIVVILLIVSAPLLFHATAKNDSARPVSLSLQRQHSGKDCTSGQLSLESQIVAYTLERPWEGNIPLISSIPTGHYHGFVRTKTKDRWRIELTDVPNRPNIQLHVGNFVADGVGCILMGSNLKSDLCTLVDSKAAFDKFKLSFAAAAAKLGQPDIDTPVELSVND